VQIRRLKDPLKICLIGATHFCHNPRLLREADSLTNAGHDVRVVTPSFTPELDRKDQRQLERRRWRHQKIDYMSVGLGGSVRSFFIRGRRRLASEVHEILGGRRLAEYSYTTALPELQRQASLEPADWFIAHAHPALPVAANAAKRWSARMGFDCEDLLAEHGTDPADVVRQIEATYLRDCDYISAPSQGIADRLKRDYDIEPPLVLYNVFPLHLAKDILSPAQRPLSPVVRLHWFSQTIGPGRGIEEAIKACGMLGATVELHLRGNPSNGYERVLQVLAAQHEANVRLHPQTDHDDLIRSMDQFDVGLALERGEHTNYALTVTNKIGSYLLAGLAIAATDTPGQREILDQIPSAGFLYPSGNPELLAEGLRRWLDDRNSLIAAQQASWDAARNRFCWDVEQRKWLVLLESTSHNSSSTLRLRTSA
jgi:glycosyltransferase involved in cell wall biosynthesis